MGAFYSKCPHCEYPAIIPRNEHGLSRRCRQCAGKYVPENNHATHNPSDGSTKSRTDSKKQVDRHRPGETKHPHQRRVREV